jgi:hypothetical protein
MKEWHMEFNNKWLHNICFCQAILNEKKLEVLLDAGVPLLYINGIT